MKEQQHEIDALKTQNEALKSRDDTIEARLDALEHKSRPSRDHFNQ